METLGISRDANFSDIESALVTVIDNQVKLRLPNTLKERGVFGMEGLVCQLVATWLRNGEYEKVFHTYCSSSDESSFEDLGSSLYGMIALRLSSKILSKELIEIDSSIALRSSYKRIQKVLLGDFPGAFKGMYVAIPSIKAHGINREYNCPFYLNENVVGHKEFRKIVGSVVDAIIPQPSRRAHIEGYISHVSEMVRELFDNTDKHGRTDYRGNTLATNFRAVIFNVVDFSEQRLMELAGGKLQSTAGIVGFVLECQGWIQNNNRSLPVLDITVVDAGPGYARKWTGKGERELSLEEEIDAVYACFSKGGTSHHNPAAGFGLTHVLKDLAKVRGWFRLRTGSVSVSKSFFLGADSSVIEKRDILPSGRFVEGSSFNIVIPLANISGGAA